MNCQGPTGEERASDLTFVRRVQCCSCGLFLNAREMIRFGLARHFDMIVRWSDDVEEEWYFPSCALTDPVSLLSPA